MRTVLGVKVLSADCSFRQAWGVHVKSQAGPRNIRVNAINPGMVETEGVHAAGFLESDLRKQVEAQTPLGRIGQPQDIAACRCLPGLFGCCVD